MTPLRQRMIKTLELLGVSPKTLKLYVDCVARIAQHFGQSPEQLGMEGADLSLVSGSRAESRMVDL